MDWKMATSRGLGTRENHVFMSDDLLMNYDTQINLSRKYQAKSERECPLMPKEKCS